MDKYLEILENEKKNIINLIQKVVEIESPSFEKSQTDYLGKLLSNIFTELTAGQIKEITNKKVGNHLIGQIGEKNREQILIVGHFDTVHPVGTLIRNPFRIEQGKIYGPGIYDMKAGLIQAIYALNTLSKLDRLRDKCIKFIFNTDEEIGSMTSKPIIEKEAKRSKFAFVMEPSFGKVGALKIARKGVGSYSIKTYGIPAHAGNCPEKGESAIEEISHQVLNLEKLNKLDQEISVNCGVINGGSAKNTIPEFAEIKIDVRVPTIKKSKKIHEYITSIKPQNPNIKLVVEGGFTRPPMEKNHRSEKLYVLAKELMHRHCQLFLPSAEVGGASDGNNISPHVATLDGLGAVGSGAHSIDEFIYMDHIVPRTALLATLIDRI